VVSAAPGTSQDLLEALGRAGLDDVDGSDLARALYSSDASLYRVLPRAVVRPRHPDEILAALAVCQELGVPVTARGAGTSIAGNAVGPGVVLDTSRYLTGISSIDPEARTAVVDPGVVQASLQAAAKPHGLRFGPDPSTHNRCTIGGMIGNNACGSRALGYGRTSDNVVALDVVTGAGQRLSLGAELGT
jgi:FAD/FMN-containing dehydrogenase